MATAAASGLEQWALPRLQELLPLDDESLRQVIQYAESLSKERAAEHLKNLLGDNGKVLEFISSFNMRRKGRLDAPAEKEGGAGSLSSSTAPSQSSRGVGGGGRGGGGGGRGKKRGAKAIHALPARQVEGQGDVAGGYVKSRAEEDYIPRSERQRHKETVADSLALRERPPDAKQMPLITDDASATTKPITSKPPPSASGPLISDGLSARKQSPAGSSKLQPKTKVNLSGGIPMHGASSNLSDLDSAIRSLEVQTNPALASSVNESEENDRRRCNCMATRHPLLDVAPNCLNCGKIICIKQGLGPCKHCNTPLLSADEISKVLRVLKDERGEERQRLNNATHKKAEVSQGKARAFTGRDFLSQHQQSSSSLSFPSSTRSTPLSSAPATPATSDDEASTKARAHRDKLLGFQAQNARRTHIHDEAADFDVPASGTNMWASPAERAAQLKRQQSMLREMEWNARPEYEKRRVVASIDLQGGRVVRKMAEVERPDFRAGWGENGDGDGDERSGTAAHELLDRGVNGTDAGAFSFNPLAKGLVKPRAREGGGDGNGKGRQRELSSRWRRVQMDEDDNEQWILDGGVYGGPSEVDAALGDEPACG